MVSVWDFLGGKKKKPTDGSDLEAVMAPQKQDNFLSQFLPSLPEDEDKRAALSRALIAGGASAMAAGGPSVGKPVNLLSALGTGLAGGVKGYDDALTTDAELAKTRIAGAATSAKLSSVADAQNRAKAFFEKYGSPTEAGYSPEALAELMKLQLMNGDDEGARATQAQLQKLQQHAADNGMVIGENGFKVAAGYGESLFDTQKSKSLGDAVGKNAEVTADVKDYEFGNKNPEFRDYELQKKRAGVANPEDKFSEKASQLAAERFNTLAQQGPQAQEMVGNIKTLTELGKNIGTGKWAQIKGTWGPWAKSMGVDVEGLDEIQGFDSLVARTAPSLRVPGSGSTSDYDAANFMKSLPSLGNTPEGNDLIGTTTNAVQANKIKAAEIANKVLSKEITWQEGDRMIAALPDPFTMFKEFKGKTGKTDKSPSGDTSKADAAPKTSRVTVVTTEEQFNALPAGTSFRFADDDTVRVKK